MQTYSIADLSEKFHIVNFNRFTGASLVKERSGIDPDFRKRSLIKRCVSATALTFFWIMKSFDPSSFSHVTCLL